MNVCVFVDGENFRHSIVDVFEGEFNRADYLPQDAKWAEFFDWLVREACGAGARRLRIYWYVLQYVDYYPYKIPSKNKSLRVLLRQHKAFKEQLDQLEGEDLANAMRGLSGQLVDTRRRFDGRFAGWHVVQDGIAHHHRAIEFRRAGSIRYNLFKQQMGQEKAVDVKLASDLIMLRDIYEAAVLVSGDQDYVPAVQAVKDAGKTVINVAFKTRRGKLLPGGARRLNHMTDSSLDVPYNTLKEFMSIPDPSLPLTAANPTKRR